MKNRWADGVSHDAGVSGGGDSDTGTGRRRKAAQWGYDSWEWDSVAAPPHLWPG